jgi:hypothetical protein
MSEPAEDTKPGTTHKVPIAKWEEAQKTAFTHWINTMLARRKTKIDDLQTGFQDGVKLIILSEVLVGKPIGQRYVEKPKLKAHKINNAFVGLKFLQDVGGVRTLSALSHGGDHSTGQLKLWTGLVTCTCPLHYFQLPHLFPLFATAVSFGPYTNLPLFRFVFHFLSFPAFTFEPLHLPFRSSPVPSLGY